MLEAVVGSTGAERVLMYLTAREHGYATDIARVFDLRQSTVQNQLARMEREGLLVSERVGRTRVYRFNPRYAFLDETRALMEKALSLAPESVQDKLLLNRRRPRRAGKPL